MKKIRIGNDFTITRTIVRGDSPEDLVNVFNPKLELISYFAVPTVNPPYTISDVNKIDVNIETQYVPKVGKYKLVFSYDVPETGFVDDFRKVTIDIANFEIVSESSKADNCNDVAAAGQIEIGIKGDSAFRVWLGEAGNAGKTKQDYFNWLQEPASEAVDAANTAAQEANTAAGLANTAAEYANAQGDYAKGIGEDVEDNETIRIGAENIRLQNEIDRINAEALRDSSETSRINAEGLRDSAESSRRSAEVLREQAKVDTIEATENANTATGLTIAAKDDYYNIVKPEIIAQGNYATAQGDYAKAQGEAIHDDFAQLADEVSLLRDDATVKIENLVVNGDFRNGMTGWKSSLGATLSIVGGNLISTANGTSQYNEFHRNFTGIVPGEKYYVASLTRVTDSNCQVLRLTLQSYGANQVASQNNPEANNWYKISNVIIPNSSASSFRIYALYSDAATANGKVIEADYIQAINLTQTFGAGNEPTKEEFELLLDILGIDYFEGEITIQAQKIMQWQLKLIRKNKNAIIALGGTII